MTLFEFILVMVSLILAIAVTHLLQGVAAIMRRQEGVKLEWTPVIWATYLFMFCTTHWWSLWDMRGIEWTYPAFFFILLPPTLLYLAVSLLVSKGLGTQRGAMQEGFMPNRVPFLVVLLLTLIFAIWDGAVLGTEPVWNSLRSVQVPGLALLLAGLFSKSWLVQRFVAGASLAMLIFIGFVLRFMAGSFGPI